MTIPSGARGASLGASLRATDPSSVHAPAASHSRRVQRIRSLHLEAFEFSIPRCPIAPYQHPHRLRVIDDLFPLRVPANTTSQPQGDVGQVADDGHAVGAFQVGGRLLAGLDTIQEVAG